MQVSACLSAAAAEHFVLLKDKQASPACRQSSIQWLKQSPAHVAEFMRMGHLHHLLQALESEGPLNLFEFFAGLQHPDH